MPALGPFQVAFIPLFTAAVLYGLYLPTFLHCLRWILFDEEGLDVRKKINWRMLSITIIFFVLMTAVIGIQFRLVVLPREVNSLAYDRLDVAVSGTTITIRLIFDAVLVFRCWVVWANSLAWRVTCLPLLLWISCLASAILLIYSDWLSAYGKVAKEVFFANTQGYRFILLFYTCNIATNIFATSAIVYRLTRVARRSGGRSHLHRISRILVESGVPYTLTSALVLAAEASAKEYRITNGILRATAGTINYSIATISFNFILIRVGQNRARPTHPAPQKTKKIALSRLRSRASQTTTSSTTLFNTGKSNDERTEIHDSNPGEMMTGSTEIQVASRCDP